MIVALTIAFVKWYVKGHVGKYFILFWANTILAIWLYVDHHSNKPKEDNTPGYVYWERNVRSSHHDWLLNDLATKKLAYMV